MPRSRYTNEINFNADKQFNSIRFIIKRLRCNFLIFYHFVSETREMNGDAGARYNKRDKININHTFTVPKSITGRWHECSWKNFERKNSTPSSSPELPFARDRIRRHQPNAKVIRTVYEQIWSRARLNVFAADRVFLPSRIFLLASNFVINSYKNVRFLWFYTSTLSHPTEQQNRSFWVNIVICEW